ncbi:helicase-related protein [Pelagibacteraceae bacterium]|nr:helicase-related protein [Pelagibacteraceae bacterium]
MSIDNENLLAILGPTNTGKTFTAFEKLFSYSSGIFGFPLRLLARENYDKAVRRIGLSNVALITGEEKILPKEAKYFFCTVESMPNNISVECVIIDEIQLTADYERGHIFTDKILNLRGNFQTIFLGSLNIENILKKMYPNISIEKKNRFSQLTFLRKQNFSKLEPRSAIIAFNINKVYEIAENIRTHKGGTAVVLGSLSPRTRNAQVEVYENKNVDYLVATDAIGMGLNLNINHVSFSSLEKFDGRYNRNLTPSELGQIAGRAGRYKQDGTFSYTKEAGNLDPLIIQQIENHNFNDIQKIYWRNSNLDFSSIDALLSSLKKYPIQNYFIHKKNALDEVNFRNLINDNEIKNFLVSNKNLKLLWDICQIPDFEKLFNDNYLLLLKDIYLILIKNNYFIPEEWINTKVNKLNNFGGGIPELSIKISQIRTWTYISNNHNWLKNSTYWKEKTQQIENELSDQLHNSLTNKFIDYSSKFFIGEKKFLNIGDILIKSNNEIFLDKDKYGIIKGFDLIEDKKIFSQSLFSISNIKKSVRNMISEKVDNFLNAPTDSISFGDISNCKINDETFIYWGEEPVGKIKKGKSIYRPIADALNSEYLSSENKLLISAKLQRWLDDEINNTLYPINKKLDEHINSEIRAIAFNCFENFGNYPVEKFKDIINAASKESKLQLSKLGIRIGAKYFYTPNLLKKKPLEFCSILWKTFNQISLNEFLPLPINGRVSFTSDVKMPDDYWQSIGYIKIKNFLFRIDVFEKIFFIARQKIKKGPFLESSDLMNPIGCNSDQLKEIMNFCGYEAITLADEKKLFFIGNKNKQPKKKLTKNKGKKINKINTKNIIKKDPNSPFAVLEKLL